MLIAAGLACASFGASSAFWAWEYVAGTSMATGYWAVTAVGTIMVVDLLRQRFFSQHRTQRAKNASLVAQVSASDDVATGDASNDAE